MKEIFKETASNFIPIIVIIFSIYLFTRGI